MNKKLRQAAVIAAALLAAGTGAAPAFAKVNEANGVHYSDSVIDKDATGSITVHKIIENDGKLVRDDGLANRTENDGNGDRMDVSSPAAALDEEQFRGKQADGTASTTFRGSKNGRSNGNTVLEGAQSDDRRLKDADGNPVTDGSGNVRTDDRDNEKFDGDEYTTALAVKGVGYSYKKAADIVSVAGQNSRNGDKNDTTDGDDENDPYSGVGTYFKNIDQELLDIGLNYGVEPKASMIDGEAYYTSAAMEAFISEIENKGGSYALSEWTALTAMESSTNTAAYSKDRTNGDFAYTDVNGIAKVDHVPLALYLISETDIHLHDGKDNDTDEASEREEDTVAEEAPILKQRSLPFLLSVPSTNVTAITDSAAGGGKVHEPGTVWQYDFDVYPKDQTTNISKAVLNPDEAAGNRTLNTRQDYQIGDTVEQVIWSDASVPQPEFDPTADTDGDTKNVPTRRADYNKYAICDRMSDGLTFTGVSKVKIINKIASPAKDSDFSGGETLDPATDYIVLKSWEGDGEKGQNAAFKRPFTEATAQANPHKFKVVLTDAGLAKLNAIEQDSQVVVFFSAKVNKDAVIGPTSNTDGGQSSTKTDLAELDANVNVPTLEFNDIFWPDQDQVVKGNRVYLFTHELDVRKDGLKDPTRASFVVTRTNSMDAAADNETNMKNVTEGVRTADGTYLTASGRDSIDPDDDQKGTGHLVFVKEEEGVYHLYDNAIDLHAATAYSSLDTSVDNYGSAVVTVLHPDSEGRLAVKGLDAEGSTYTLKEIRTEKGHNLLKDTVNIELKEKKAAMEGEAVDGSTDVWKDGRLVSSDEEEPGSKPTDGSFVSIGNTAAALTISSDNAGIAQMEIDNYKAITLRTGGSGLAVLYLSAGIGTAVLVLAAAVDRRKKKAKKIF
ncbi:MAG: isopeptide-forming domain-containing fimbrial protein [Eubacterium sp.]|nr:isopeptide-forming domain-containing fimbrial protein [Eubacterium sp.]